MGTRDLTHKAIAEALSNDRLLTHDQRAALLTLVADDSVWQRKHDEAAAEVTRLVDKCNSYIADNARLAEQVENLRTALSEIVEVVSLPREPNWTYRNTITTNRDRIKASCRAGLGV